MSRNKTGEKCRVEMCKLAVPANFGTHRYMGIRIILPAWEK
jgi:hypothetical protein